jgi:hypothetical protein
MHKRGWELLLLSQGPIDGVLGRNQTQRPVVGRRGEVEEPAAGGNVVEKLYFCLPWLTLRTNKLERLSPASLFSLV